MKHYGMSFVQYANARKLARAERFLVSTNRLVREIGELLGFPAISYFCRWFKRCTGLRPLEYRQRKGSKEAPQEGASTQQEKGPQQPQDTTLGSWRGMLVDGDVSVPVIVFWRRASGGSEVEWEVRPIGQPPDAWLASVQGDIRDTNIGRVTMGDNGVVQGQGPPRGPFAEAVGSQ